MLTLLCQHLVLILLPLIALLMPTILDRLLNSVQTHPAYQLVIGPEYVQAEASTATVYCSQAHLLFVDDLVVGSLLWHVQVF